MDDVDFYQLLGVDPGVDADTLKAAYRQAVKRAHPDLGGTPGMFRLIELAYQTLNDPRSRDTYDRRRQTPPPDPTPPQPDIITTATSQTPGDILWGAGVSGSPHVQPPRGATPPGPSTTVWQRRRWWWQRRLTVAATAAVTATAVWLSRLFELHHHLGTPGVVTSRLDDILSNPAVVVVGAAGVTGWLLHQDRWRIVGRLPPGPARFAVPACLAAVSVAAESVTRPVGWGGVVAVTAAGGWVGYRWGRGPGSNWQITSRARTRPSRR